MISFTINTNGLTKEQKWFIAEAIKWKAKEICPVDYGDLMASIDYQINDNEIIVFASDEKAYDIEYGTPPTVLSPSEKGEITKWAHRHGVKGNQTQKYISEHGIKVGTPEDPLHVIWQGRNSYRPFLRTAIFQIVNNKDNFKKVLKGEKFL